MLPAVPTFVSVTPVAKKPIAVFTVGSTSALVHAGSATQDAGAVGSCPPRRR
jgi:hypothetical protein